MTGKIHTTQTRSKISEALKGNKNTVGNTNPAKPTSVYSLDGSLVKRFCSGAEAANFLGVSISCVYHAIQRGSVVKGQYRIARDHE